MKTRNDECSVIPLKSGLSRREILKLSGVALAGAALPPMAGCKGGGPAATSDTACLKNIPHTDVEVDIFGPASIMTSRRRHAGRRGREHSNDASGRRM